MNSNEYTVIMPYKELVKWIKIEEDYKKLKKDIIDCFEIDENISEVCLNKDKTIQIGKELLPLRYGEYNYAVR